MSDQGVAQRVLRELAEQDGQDKWTFSETARDAGKVEGAKYLYAELSAEARRVLAELDAAADQLRIICPDGPGFRVYEDEALIIRGLCHCLGLDLEPEDSDD